MERLYSYKMSHDNRFAPNPLFGVLTLATCKPQLRKNAKVGDWIAGWTSSHIAHTPTPVGEERLIYLARVSEKLTFAEYWEAYLKCSPTASELQLLVAESSIDIDGFSLQKWSPVASEINRDEFLGISFSHHMEILHKTRDIHEVLFYIHQSVL